MQKLHDLGYGTYDLLLNSSDFGVPQNRVRLYILGILGAEPKMTLQTNLGATDSHAFKKKQGELSLFDFLMVRGELLYPRFSKKM